MSTPVQKVRALLLAAIGGALLVGALQAQGAPGARPAMAARAVFLDSAGVVRWQDNRQEVTLFGANYVLPTASDYRAAGYIHADRKKMIDEDMAQFARMGWDGLRLTFWGDWEASDAKGNLIANEHLDLQDYLIASARARGIYMLFSPIQLYSANWPDAQGDTTAPGFGRRFARERMGTDSVAIAAQVNYLRQLLNHVNPYTGVALKDEPAILFIELVNEPVHHPEDQKGSIAYINTLTDAVRSTNCNKLIFYNVSQDFRIAEAVRRSKAQGVTFGWYPTGLNSGHELEGNYLRGVDTFPDMLRPEIARMPRIVYEFDSPDLRTGTMYPAMARTFRSVGTQFAAMFAYDMLATASRNLGWQTHYLNLVYTPRKAMSAIIAAEAMHRLPRMRSYGPYPQNTQFGDFHVSYDENLGELVAKDAFLYAGSTHAAPPEPASLRRIAGYGSSSTVTYEGDGIYFLDRVRPGVWRLEVYPDAEPIADPFVMPSVDKIVTRAISRAWPMSVSLPDLGLAFTVQPIAAGNPQSERTAAGRFSVTPGVYLLSATGPVDLATLPAFIGNVGMAEYHAPPLDSLPTWVQPLTAPSYLAGRDATLRARVVDRSAPDSVTLFFRATAGGFARAFAMHAIGGYEYAATIPGALMVEGPHQFEITALRGNSVTTFPGGLHRKPTDWDYTPGAAWPLDVVALRTPLLLFNPGADIARMAFSRIGDGGRTGLFREPFSGVTGQPVFHLERPVDARGWSPDDYTASLVIKDRIAARRESLPQADAVQVRMRGVGAHQIVHVTLVEADGTSWSTAVASDSSWSEHMLPIDSFTQDRSVLLPEGFPGEWNYWVGPAVDRLGKADRLQLDRVERLQLSLRREDSTVVRSGSYGVEVEWVRLAFGRVVGPSPR